MEDRRKFHCSETNMHKSGKQTLIQMDVHLIIDSTIS